MEQLNTSRLEIHSLKSVEYLDVEGEEVGIVYGRFIAPERGGERVLRIYTGLSQGDERNQEPYVEFCETKTPNLGNLGIYAKMTECLNKRLIPMDAENLLEDFLEQ